MSNGVLWIQGAWTESLDSDIEFKAWIQSTDSEPAFEARIQKLTSRFRTYIQSLNSEPLRGWIQIVDSEIGFRARTQRPGLNTWIQSLES